MYSESDATRVFIVEEISGHPCPSPDTTVAAVFLIALH